MFAFELFRFPPPILNPRWSKDAVCMTVCLAHSEVKCETANSALTSSSACSELSRLRLKLSSLATSLFSFLTVLISAAFSLPSRCACSSDVFAYIKQQESMLTIARGTTLRCQSSLACTSSQATIREIVYAAAVVSCCSAQLKLAVP